MRQPQPPFRYRKLQDVLSSLRGVSPSECHSGLSLIGAQILATPVLVEQRRPAEGVTSFGCLVHIQHPVDADLSKSYLFPSNATAMGEQHEAARRSRRWQRSIRALVDPDPDYRVLASLASIQDWALWRQLWRRVDSGGGGISMSGVDGWIEGLCKCWWSGPCGDALPASGRDANRLDPASMCRARYIPFEQSSATKALCRLPLMTNFGWFEVGLSDGVEPQRSTTQNRQ